MGFERIFLIVLDSVGIGELPDAARFGDEGSNTFKSIACSEKFSIPTLKILGIGHIEGLDFIEKADGPNAAVLRLAEQSMGKDTTIGHWELSGIISGDPLPTYPDGFPREILDEFCARTGRGVLCNKPYSGTNVIMDYGEEHLKTGALIVYTSADSVFQIAAHEDTVSVDELYSYCEIAREILNGKHGVGRVIARPFAGEYPNFYRTSGRHDFSIKPPRKTLLDYVSNAGLEVIAIGKINDIFAGVGVTESIYTKNNREGMQAIDDVLKRDFKGLCFANLVDFDMLYGHRNDVDGYAAALSEFDAWLAGAVNKLGDNDVIIITADHGCDPATESTDHSREYTPAVIFGKKIKSGEYGTRKSFSDIAATVADMLGIEYGASGESFAKNITNEEKK